MTRRKARFPLMEKEMKIVHFDSLPSTNDYAKAYEEREDLIVTASRQTAGRGSKNRSFVSDMGGVYLTKRTHYDSFSAGEVFRIMIDSSVAVCRTIEEFGLKPAIKWPNDVYIDGKKVCGILIENTFSGNFISSSVVGIGLNVNNVLPAELQPIATTMFAASGKEFCLESVRDRLIDRLKERYSLEDYRKYIFFLGKEVVLIENGERKEVTALDVDSLGRLVVRDGERVRTVTAGEVSFRFQG